MPRHDDTAALAAEHFAVCPDLVWQVAGNRAHQELRVALQGQVT